MTWIWLLALILAIALIVMLRNNAEESETRHAAPGQGKPPELKEREEHESRPDTGDTKIYRSDRGR